MGILFIITLVLSKTSVKMLLVCLWPMHNFVLVIVSLGVLRFFLIILVCIASNESFIYPSEPGERKPVRPAQITRYEKIESISMLTRH